MSRVWITTIAALDGANNPVTLRFADGAHVDDDANFYEPRMRQPALMRVSANGGALLSTGDNSIGEMELINADGGLNYLLDYAVDGRKCTISIVTNGVQVEYFSGTITKLAERGNLLRLTLRPSLQMLEAPYPLDTYNRESLKGVYKPVLWGRVDNAQPLLIDAPLLIYKACVGNGLISNVRDSGIELVRGADYTSASEMETVEPLAGQFRCFHGQFRLGASPVGLITFDATHDGLTAGKIIKKLLLPFDAELCAACEVELDSIGGQCGIYLTDTNNTMSGILTKIGEALGFYWFYADGLIKCKLLAPPVASGGKTINEWSILSIERKSTAVGAGGVPVQSVRIPHSLVSTVQEDLATGVTDVLRTKLSQQWRFSEAESAATIIRHPLSEKLMIAEGFSFDSTKTDTVANRVLGVLSVRRDSVSVDVQIDAIGPVDIGDSVTVFSRRLGYELGRVMICVGYELDARKNRIKLELFG